VRRHVLFGEKGSAATPGALEDGLRVPAAASAGKDAGGPGGGGIPYCARAAADGDKVPLGCGVMSGRRRRFQERRFICTGCGTVRDMPKWRPGTTVAGHGKNAWCCVCGEVRRFVQTEERTMEEADNEKRHAPAD